MSEAIKKSVRLAGSTVNTIKSVNKGDSVNWSRSINIIASRYSLFTKYGLPSLTDNEKLIMVMCFGGREIIDSNIEHEIEFLHLQVAQGVEKPETTPLFIEDNKSLSDGDLENIKRQFCERAKLWDTTERLAILHHVDSVWAENKTGMKNLDNDNQ